MYTTDYGLRSLKFFAPKIWNIMPIDIGNSNSLSEFTTKIKSWKPVTCPCNLCRTFVGQVTCPCNSCRTFVGQVIYASFVIYAVLL